jgi:transcriptional regulator with XRE-family HTH domain
MKQIEAKDPVKEAPKEAYRREKERICSEHGGLEQIRHRLGLSQRKLCQLLLVDPSAWTRWLKSDAPPHVYQALNWLLQLKKMNPDATAPSQFSGRLDLLTKNTDKKIEDLERQISFLERSLILSSIHQSEKNEAEPLTALQNKISALELALKAIQSKPKKPKSKAKRKAKIKPVVKSKKRKKKKIIRKKVKKKKKKTVKK